MLSALLQFELETLVFGGKARVKADKLWLFKDRASSSAFMYAGTAALMVVDFLRSSVFR